MALANDKVREELILEGKRMLMIQFTKLSQQVYSAARADLGGAVNELVHGAGTVASLQRTTQSGCREFDLWEGRNTEERRKLVV